MDDMLRCKMPNALQTKSIALLIHSKFYIYSQEIFRVNAIRSDLASKQL